MQVSMDVEVPGPQIPLDENLRREITEEKGDECVARSAHVCLGEEVGASADEGRCGRL